MKNNDYLLHLMKHEADRVIMFDEKMQRFLNWANQKAISLPSVGNQERWQVHPSALRAFYIALSSPVSRDLSYVLDPRIPSSLALPYDRGIRTFLNVGFYVPNQREINLDRFLINALNKPEEKSLDYAIEYADSELLEWLKLLKEQLPEESNLDNWIEKLRAVIIEHRNIGHDWKFDKQQKKLLRKYYEANKLLVDCLVRTREASPKVIWGIIDTLLLPIEPVRGNLYQ